MYLETPSGTLRPLGNYGQLSQRGSYYVRYGAYSRFAIPGQSLYLSLLISLVSDHLLSRSYSLASAKAPARQPRNNFPSFPNSFLETSVFKGHESHRFEFEFVNSSQLKNSKHRKRRSNWTAYISFVALPEGCSTSTPCSPKLSVNSRSNRKRNSANQI